MMLGSLVLDAVSFAPGHIVFPALSSCLLAGGIMSGLGVCTVRLKEWSGVPKEEPEWPLGLWRSLSAILVVILFGWSWSVRATSGDPSLLSFALLLCAAGILLTPARLGAGFFDRLASEPENEAEGQNLHS
jgi:hypothetical protein